MLINDKTLTTAMHYSFKWTTVTGIFTIFDAFESKQANLASKQASKIHPSLYLHNQNIFLIAEIVSAFGMSQLLVWHSYNIGNCLMFINS